MTQIIVSKESIFELNSEILVCPVNCKGVMGAGLAKKFKEKYPECEKLYQNLCKDKILNAETGEWGLSYLAHREDNPFGIIFFPTKNHWKDKSNEEGILAGLRNLADEIKIVESVNNEPAFSEIAIPKLGCGLGGLSWEKLKPKLIKIFNASDLKTIIKIVEHD